MKAGASRRSLASRLPELVGGGLGAALVLAIVTVQLRGCVVGPWKSSDKSVNYSVLGGDGRQLDLLVLPENRVLLLYHDPRRRHLEGVSAIWRGTDADHYFGRLWRTDGPGGLMGWRLMPRGFEPYSIEMEVVDKFVVGGGQSDFADTGRRTRSIVGFAADRILFADMVLQRTALDHTVFDALQTTFTDPATLEALTKAKPP